ncbi:hypothetical protein Hanom_Chr14g01292601 [Helianthus anomalus]
MNSPSFQCISNRFCWFGLWRCLGGQNGVVLLFHALNNLDVVRGVSLSYGSFGVTCCCLMLILL